MDLPGYELAFDEPEQVRTLFERHAPYPAIAGYQSDRVHIADSPMDETSSPAEQAAFAWFRGNWAANGEPLVEGAGTILHNQQFFDAARTFFRHLKLRPTFIVLNVNAPMPAGPPHVDIPTFRGTTRDHYPLRFLKATGASGLFERWRVIQAGAITPLGAVSPSPIGLILDQLLPHHRALTFLGFTSVPFEMPVNPALANLVLPPAMSTKTQVPHGRSWRRPDAWLIG
jgi:hypothetical protein